MKKESTIVVAVPADALFDDFAVHIDSLHIDDSTRFRAFRAPETTCAEMLLTHRAEIALITPLGYGLGVAKADFRVIPDTTALISEGFTGLASIYFNDNLDSIDTIATLNPKSFITATAKIILAEKFDIHPQTLAVPGNLDEQLQQAAAVIRWSENDYRAASLDISEEWNDVFEMPLPLAFWACRPDELPENLPELIANFAKESMPEKEYIADENFQSEHDVFDDGRSGIIHYRWNKIDEESLFFVLESLFYNQYLSAIPAVKLFGRD